MATYFVSDLHLFSRRSHAPRHHEALLTAARTANTFVLGGDIFDFRWTTLGSIDETIQAASAWLSELVQTHPQCQFHFILGNHDSHPHFVTSLAELAETSANLSWHRYYVRMERSLFLHGDVADIHMNAVRLTKARSQPGHAHKRGSTANWLYDIAIQARLHKLAASMAHPKRRVARKILKYLEHIGHGPGNGLEHVYFGHTHMAMTNYQYRGLSFHNGGAPMKGLEFRILETLGHR